MRELAGGIDVALLPIAGWGPRLQTAHHLGPATAAKAAAELQPRTVVPIHWGTLLRIGLGDRARELMARPASEFAAHMAELAPNVAVHVLLPGQSMPLVAAAR
jgi:L-ascorbate metabolism protein UlaG (beta-lactamase superfamily)